MVARVNMEQRSVDDCKGDKQVLGGRGHHKRVVVRQQDREGSIIKQVEETEGERETPHTSTGRKRGKEERKGDSKITY